MDGIDFASYAGDNTPYTIGNNREGVIFKLQNSSKYFYNGLWITKCKLTLTNVTLSVVLMIQLILFLRIK